MPATTYWVYIVACRDGTYYTGIATDVARRLLEHNGTPGKLNKGARYTASRRPVSLVFAAPFANRSEAAKEEIRIKQMTRSQKLQLIAMTAVGQHDLS
jgi:putative endonuclease